MSSGSLDVESDNYICGDRHRDQSNLRHAENNAQSLERSTLDRERKSRWYLERIQRDQLSMAEYRCLIRWAEGKLQVLSGEEQKIGQRYEVVQKAIVDVKDEKLKTCGEDKRTGLIAVDERYREYQNCIAPYDREMRRLEQDLNQAKRELKMIEQ